MFLFGELTAIETICHLMVTSELVECYLSIPSSFDEDSSIDLYVTLDKNTENDVKIIDRFTIYYNKSKIRFKNIVC